jgi:RNA polymerase sigma factor (TIGR02999 family)
MSDVTRILNAIDGGDPKAADELLPLVYEELRLLAAQKMSQERPGQTLQATALVHEAYIRLVGDDPQDWDSRGHFFSAAAEATRRILVDNACRKKSAKSGGKQKRVELDDAIVVGEQTIHPNDLLILNDSLDKLATRDKVAADLVKLRVFGGLPVKEAARLLGISQSKAYVDLEYALAWLNLEMSDNQPCRETCQA